MPAYTVNNPATICEGDSFFAAGDWQFVSGNYHDTLATIDGCDSLIITILDVLPTYSIAQQISICDGDSFYAAGSYQLTSGIYVDVLPSSDGCDSIIITDIQVNSNIVINRNLSICDGDSVFVGGAFQYSSGTYVDSSNTTRGCDSIVITQIIVNANFNTIVDLYICDGDSAFLQNAFQTTPDLYYDTLFSINGCDSVIATNLFVLQHITTPISVSICEGDSFFVQGEWQQTAGVYYDTLLAGNSCDSIVITNLSVNSVYGVFRSDTICEPDSLFVSGSYQTSSGIYYDTLSSVRACDSIIITNLIVNPIKYATDSKVICEGDSIFVGGGWQSEEGTFVDVLTSISGCDSILETELIVLDNSVWVEPVYQVIQNGESVFIQVHSSSDNPILYWEPPDGLSCDDCLDPTATPDSTITYMGIVVSENGCIDSVQVLIELDNGEFTPNSCYKVFYIPNAFTPNGDAINDIFYAYGRGVEEITLKIYNRWGEKLFESNDLTSGWDGTYRGELLNPGVYVYHVKVLFCDGSRLPLLHEYRKGSITLIR